MFSKPVRPEDQQPVAITVDPSSYSCYHQLLLHHRLLFSPLLTRWPVNYYNNRSSDISLVIIHFVTFKYEWRLLIHCVPNKIARSFLFFFYFCMYNIWYFKKKSKRFRKFVYITNKTIFKIHSSNIYPSSVFNSFVTV